MKYILDTRFSPITPALREQLVVITTHIVVPDAYQRHP